jgi:D-alanine transaminase
VAEPFPTCWLNGTFRPLIDARISPLDRGFLFGDGVYEVVPVHRGRPFRLRQHLERFERSLAEVRIRNPLTRNHWAHVLRSLSTRASAAELLVYVQVTRGSEFGRNHLFPPAEVEPTAFAFVSPYPEPATATLSEGLAAATCDDTRWARCDIKSTALLANVLLRQEAHDKGAAEALLIRDGELMEGSSSTVFVVTGGRLATPPNTCRILPGTSRDAVLELAAEMGVPSEIRPIAAAELASCDEVWIASAGRGVLPVSSIDGRPVGSGKPGPVWQAVYARLQQHLDAIAKLPDMEDG